MNSQRGFGVVEALGLLLLLSLAGNAFLFWSRDNAIEAAAKFEVTATSWKTAADTCTTSVDKLASKGDQRQKALLTALTAEAGRIKTLQHDALAAIAARPDDPKDLCGSLERYLRGEIKKEAGK